MKSRVGCHISTSILRDCWRETVNSSGSAVHTILLVPMLAGETAFRLKSGSVWEAGMIVWVIQFLSLVIKVN
jgi:hypothetical protein